jgi:3-deoxy-alpha-D-manno-octulosonate 8-oxidase
MIDILNTGIRNVRNVDRFIFYKGAIIELESILTERRKSIGGSVVFVIDKYFEGNPKPLGALPCDGGDQLVYVSTEHEPTTESVDCLLEEVWAGSGAPPCTVVGIGGGSTLDTAKAISNLLTNGGRSEDYQGWDLVPAAGVYKVGVPTISGTGSETTRTCVITNKETGLKLGMNSDYTVFDQLILDPNLTATVPRAQYFFTGMDAWIHCLEALNGSFRNPVGDAMSAQAIDLCGQVFHNNEMMSGTNRSKLMVASYLGGCAIATSYVGVVHPFSAGLSIVLGLHHCVANCVTMMAMGSFYPDGHREFMAMVEKQNIDVPKDVCLSLSDEQFHALYEATIIHEKPLTNALGNGFREILTEGKVRNIFEKM